MAKLMWGLSFKIHTAHFGHVLEGRAVTQVILDKTAHVLGVDIGGTGINWRGHGPLPPRRHRR